MSILSSFALIILFNGIVFDSVASAITCRSYGGGTCTGNYCNAFIPSDQYGNARQNESSYFCTSHPLFPNMTDGCYLLADAPFFDYTITCQCQTDHCTNTISSPPPYQPAVQCNRGAITQTEIKSVYSDYHERNAALAFASAPSPTYGNYCVAIQYSHGCNESDGVLGNPVTTMFLSLNSHSSIHLCESTSYGPMSGTVCYCNQPNCNNANLMTWGQAALNANGRIRCLVIDSMNKLHIQQGTFCRAQVYQHPGNVTALAALASYLVTNSTYYSPKCTEMTPYGNGSSLVDIFCDTDLCNQIYPRRHCADLYQYYGMRSDGIYSVDLNGTEVDVYCEMTAGGWTRIQRTWQDYKTGFGNPNGSFWLGNAYLNFLTTQTSMSLQVELWKCDMTYSYENYSSFQVGTEASGFQLSVSSGSGQAGDALNMPLASNGTNGTTTNNGQSFRTFDRPSSNNCPARFGGGWWYSPACGYGILNGVYHSGCNYTGPANGILWWTLVPSACYSIHSVVMKIKPTAQLPSVPVSCSTFPTATDHLQPAAATRELIPNILPLKASFSAFDATGKEEDATFKHQMADIGYPDYCVAPSTTPFTGTTTSTVPGSLGTPSATSPYTPTLPITTFSGSLIDGNLTWNLNYSNMLNNQTELIADLLKNEITSCFSGIFHSATVSIEYFSEANITWIPEKRTFPDMLWSSLNLLFSKPGVLVASQSVRVNFNITIQHSPPPTEQNIIDILNNASARFGWSGIHISLDGSSTVAASTTTTTTASTTTSPVVTTTPGTQTTTTKTTKILHDLAQQNLTYGNITDILKELNNTLTNANNTLQPGDVVDVSIILNKTSLAENISSTDFELFMNSADILLNTDASVIAKSQTSFHSSASIILKSFNNLAVNFNGTSANYTGPNIAITVRENNCSNPSEAQTGFAQNTESIVQSLIGNASVDTSSVQASIQLPKSVACPNTSETQRISFMLFGNLKLFVPVLSSDQRMGVDAGATPASIPTPNQCSSRLEGKGPAVVRAQLVGGSSSPPMVDEHQMLSEPVRLQFKMNSPPDGLHSNLTAGYWNYSFTDWLGNGCFFDSVSSDNVYSFHCTHLTDFTLLVDTLDTDPTLCDNGLSLFGYIVTGISTIALTAALIASFIAFVRKPTEMYAGKRGMQRTSDKSQDAQLLTISFMTALCLFDFLFELVADGYSVGISDHNCTLVAAVLYTLMISVLCWSFFMAVRFFAKYSMMIKRGFPQFLLSWYFNTSIATGVPIIITLILWFTSANGVPGAFFSRKDSFCWINASYVGLGVMLPVSFNIVASVVLFVMLSWNLFCREYFASKGDSGGHSVRIGGGKSSKSSRFLKELSALLMMQVTLGLPWVLQYFTLFAPRLVAMHYIFTIFNATQGLWIAIFCLIKDWPEIQKNLRRKIHPKQGNSNGPIEDESMRKKNDDDPALQQDNMEKTHHRYSAPSLNSSSGSSGGDNPKRPILPPEKSGDRASLEPGVQPQNDSGPTPAPRKLRRNYADEKSDSQFPTNTSLPTPLRRTTFDSNEQQFYYK